MRNIAFLISMIILSVAKAEECKVSSVDDITGLISSSSLNAEILQQNIKVIDSRYELSVQTKRPEIGIEYLANKDSFSESEISASAMFDIDNYRKYDLQKKLAKAEQELNTLSSKRGFNESLITVSLSFFKVSQNKFLLEKIEGLLETIKSSERLYKSKPIRSREEETVLNSLSLLRNSLALKISQLKEELYENQIHLSKLNGVTCEIDYASLIKIVGTLNSSVDFDGDLYSSLLAKTEINALKTGAEFERKRLFNDLKVGPSLQREVVSGEAEYRFGVAVTFDFPRSMSASNDLIESTNRLAQLEFERKNKLSEVEVNLAKLKFQRHSEILKQLPTMEKLESDVRKVKKAFDSGAVSPLVYLEAYRSYVDFLESAEKVRLNVLISYLNLRGMYVKSNNL